MATSSAAIAWISAPKARSPETFPPCASAWKTAPPSKVEFRSAAKANQTSLRDRSQPRPPRPWLPPPARNWRDDYRIDDHRITEQGHARACPCSLVTYVKSQPGERAALKGRVSHRDFVGL